MKDVDLAIAISEFDGREVSVLKLFQAIGFGHLGVEAFRTKLPITRVHGTEVDDVVVGNAAAAAYAVSLMLWSGHFQLSIAAGSPCSPFAESVQGCLQ